MSPTETDSPAPPIPSVKHTTSRSIEPMTSMTTDEAPKDGKKHKKEKKSKKEKKRKEKKKEKKETEQEEPIIKHEEEELVVVEPPNDTSEPPNDADEPQETSDEPKSRRKRKRKRKNVILNPTQDEQEHAKDTLQQDKIDQVDRTVYIEGLPFDETVESVKAFFTNNSITIDDCRLPTWQDSGRLRGYGHVVCRTATDFTQALALSGQHIGRRYVTIQKANRPQEVSNDTTAEPSRTVLLNNLSYDATEADIETVMEQFGTIDKGGVRVVRHSATGRSKGFGYVSFVQVASAERAMQSRIIICGRPCRLDYDHGRVKGSFRTADRTLWQSQFRKNA